MFRKYAIYCYFISAIIAYVFLCYNVKIYSAGLRVLGVASLVIAFYIQDKWSSPLFYLSLIFSTIFETLVIYGGENYQNLFLTCSFSYYWLTFFLIKRNIKEPRYKLYKDRLFPAILTVIFILYLVISVFVFVFEKIEDSYAFPIISTIAFLTVVFYMGFIYIASRTQRNFWILLVMIAFIVNFIIVIIDALVLESICLMALIFCFEVLSHYFIYRFLLTPEKEFTLNNTNQYL